MIPPDLDGASFKEFYEATIPAMRRYALLVTQGHEHDAYDAMQDAYAEAWKRWDTLRPDHKDRVNYVRRSLVRAAMKNRSRWQRSLQLTKAAFWANERETASSERTALASMELRAAWAVIINLPPSLQDVAVLHWVVGLEYKEIAETLGVKVTTVGSRINKIRKRFDKGGAAEREIQAHLAEEGVR